MKTKPNKHNSTNTQVHPIRVVRILVTKNSRSRNLWTPFCLGKLTP